MKADLPQRGNDIHGSGEYGASRGSRTHRGIDLACYPGSLIYSPVSGKVTKLGFPYAHDLSIKYVQITDSKGFDHRCFYVNPLVSVGVQVTEDDIIGTSQELPYKGITQHVHYEIKKDGDYLNPNEFHS